MADIGEDFVTPDVEFSDDGADSDDATPVNADDRSHNKLLNAIGALDGKKRLKLLQRSEPSREVSEFALSAAPGKVRIHELVGALQKTNQRALKKQINRVKKKKTVEVPLSKHDKQRVERTLAYEETSKELSKWDPVIRENRTADQLKFPLEQPSVRLVTTNEVVKRFQVRTPLELEIAQVLHGSQNVFSMDKMLTPAEERALKAMSLEEARERRAELQKYRALLSYQEAKARRQKKIKSKTFHRVLRKERQKKEKKVLDALEKTDPEEYVERLKKIEKDRIQERMSLKHRGGSKKMQKNIIYGKYDEGARQAVQDMIQKSKELREKTNVTMESDSDDNMVDDDVIDKPGNQGELIDVALATAASGSNNPWMLPPTTKKVSKYAKLQPIVNTANTTVEADESDDEEVTKKKDDLDIDELFEEMQEKRKALQVESTDVGKFSKKNSKNKRKLEKLKAKRKAREVERLKELGEYEEFESSSENEQEDEKVAPNKGKDDEGMIHSSLTRKRTLEDLDGDWSDDGDKAQSKKQATNEDINEELTAESSVEKQIDPRQVVTVETSMRSSMNPDLISDDEEEEMDEDTKQRMTIAQAFADDDVIDEFDAEKRDVESRDKPQDIDLTLPGWGEWHGEGVEPSQYKKKRFVIKAPEAPPRKDRGLTNVIISETKDNSIAKHQVSQLPFPFGSVRQFESSVRAPIGNTWNPETAFQQLTKPKKLTRLGTIIDPIDKSEMFKKQKFIAMKRKQLSEKREVKRAEEKKQKAKEERRQKKKQQ